MHLCSLFCRIVAELMRKLAVMKAKSDKRRETARRLRAAAEQADPAVGVSELEIFCILDVDMGGERGFADMQDVLRLADLIDRPARQGSEKGDER